MGMAFSTYQVTFVAITIHFYVRIYTFSTYKIIVISSFLGDKPFSCDICQKKFALGCNLRAHLRTHEAEYQSSPASLELYRRTLEMLAAQDAAGSGKSSPGASDLGQDGLESGLDEEEEEEVDLGMEDVEEDEVDPGSNESVAAPSDGKIVSDKDKLLMSSLPKFAAAAAAAAAAVPAV